MRKRKYWESRDWPQIRKESNINRWGQAQAERVKSFSLIYITFFIAIFLLWQFFKCGNLKKQYYLKTNTKYGKIE